jgi:hypothetical protein
MGYPDIELARSRQAALRRLIDEHTDDAADLRRLRRVLAASEELCEAIDDSYCRDKVRAVQECAAELLSASEHRSRGALCGADFLREQIRSALELVQSRLYSLERVRRHGQLSLRSGASPHFAG